jgi:hypothetical protein
MNNYLKQLTPEKKLLLSIRLYHSAKELKEAALKKLHPELTPDEIRQKVKEIFLNART